jgi:glycosyltransferase involved in cell wall biosynthesis
VEGSRNTLVFIPAWNEERNLPAVLDELAEGLPDVDVLVVDDGSTDGTVRVARARGAEVESLGENRGLPFGVAAGYAFAAEHGYAYCGRVDADGQHPVVELARLLARVRSGECDVAVGSRFVSGDGYEAGRYQPSPARVVGTSLLRQGMRHVLGRPFADATSGMYAVNAKAMPILAEPYATGAPEVEGLLRLRDAGLVVKELPVNMRERASGESKLAGKKALLLVLTVIGTLFAYRRVRGR